MSVVRIEWALRANDLLPPIKLPDLATVTPPVSPGEHGEISICARFTFRHAAHACSSQ
jgi:hypothetical protein